MFKLVYVEERLKTSNTFFGSKRITITANLWPVKARST